MPSTFCLFFCLVWYAILIFCSQRCILFANILFIVNVAVCSCQERFIRMWHCFSWCDVAFAFLKKNWPCRGHLVKRNKATLDSSHLQTLWINSIMLAIRSILLNLPFDWYIYGLCNESYSVFERRNIFNFLIQMGHQHNYIPKRWCFKNIIFLFLYMSLQMLPKTELVKSFDLENHTVNGEWW